MVDELLTALTAATDPAEKAALIAEFTLADLPPDVAAIARRCVVLHWFDVDSIAGLLPPDSSIPADDIYRQLADLPFIETLSTGLAYHDLTRTGLLARLSRNQPDLLRETTAIVAPIYQAREGKLAAQLEALYCHIVAGNSDTATELMDKLLLQTHQLDDWQTVLNIFEIQAEADALPFVNPFARNWLHWAICGLMYANFTRHEKALENYNQALKLNPDEPITFYNRGNTYYELKQYDSALADYQRAIELKPDYATAFYNRGNTYSELKQYDSALADYQRAIELKPDYATAYNNRGNTYKELKQYDSALADYQRAIELKPDDATAFYNMACAYALQSDVEGALPPLRRALELTPEENLALIPSDADFDAIRDDPRFVALLAEFLTTTAESKNQTD